MDDGTTKAIISRSTENRTCLEGEANKSLRCAGKSEACTTVGGLVEEEEEERKL